MGKVLFFFIFLSFSASASIIYEGRLLDSSNNAITNTVKVSVKVMAQSGSSRISSGSDCTLLQKEKSLNTTATDGWFKIEITDTDFTADSAGVEYSDSSNNTTQKVFTNSASLGALNCAEGVNYTPTNDFETRELELVILEVGGSDIPDVTLAPRHQFTPTQFATSSVRAMTTDQIRGINVSTTSPTNGQVLAYDGSEYVPSNVSATSIAWTIRSARSA